MKKPSPPRKKAVGSKSTGRKSASIRSGRPARPGAKRPARRAAGGVPPGGKRGAPGAGPRRAARPSSVRVRRRGIPAETKVAGITDEAVQRGTGKTWEEWLALLDTAGAEQMDHRSIVRYLVDGYGLAEWWRQMVTVGYEQARGLRVKHERPEGFQISRSKTYPVGIEQLYELCSDPRQRLRWLPEGPLTVRKATPHKSVRITWVDGASSVELTMVARSEEKSQLTIQHSKLPDARQAERMKGFWEHRLASLGQLVGGAED